VVTVVNALMDPLVVSYPADHMDVVLMLELLVVLINYTAAQMGINVMFQEEPVSDNKEPMISYLMLD